MLSSIPQQKLFNLYQKRKQSTYKIAKLYHCYPTQIRKLLQQHNIKIRSRKEAILIDRGISISKNYLNKLYLQNNLSSTQIANILYCDPSTIVRKLHEFAIPIKPPAEKIKISKQELENLYFRRKLSCNNIAKYFNCSIKTLRKRIRLYGIKLRPNKNVTIDIKVLKNLYHKRKFSLKRIGQLHHLTPTAVLKKMKKMNISLRTSWENNIIHPKKSFNGSLEEKAYLIGFRLGDLGVTQKSKLSGSIIVKSNTTKPEQITLMNNLFSPYSHVWISGPVAKGVFHFTTLLDSSFDFLIPKNDAVPKWIRNNINFSSAFIAGYTDAEGNIGVYGGQARFRIGSYDIGILKWIHEFFRRLGFKSNIRLEQQKGFIDKRGLIHNGDFWRVSVNEKNSLLKLFDLLFPYMKHQKRKTDLLKARLNINQRNNAIIHIRKSNHYEQH